MCLLQEEFLTIPGLETIEIQVLPQQEVSLIITKVTTMKTDSGNNSPGKGGERDLLDIREEVLPQ